MEPTRPRVVSFVRVSTTQQAGDDRGGMPRQRAEIKRIIETKRLNCVRHYEVSNVSGTAVRNCPEVIEILGRIACQEIDGIVVADLDRFLRADRFDAFALLQDFQDAGATIYTSNSDADFSTPDGILMAAIKVTLSGHELNMLRARVQGAKEAKRKAGKCPSSAITLPRGVRYHRKSETFYYDDATIGPVIEAFRLVDEEGISNQAEISRLTGIQPRTVSNLLRNPIYMGRRLYDTKRGREKYSSENGAQSDRKKVRREKDEIINVEVIHIPAVSPERFARVQEILAQTRGKWAGRRASKAVNLGVGIAKCGFCGEPLYPSSGKRSGRASAIGYYVCKKNYYLYRKESGGCAMRNIRKDHLDETLRKFTGEHLASVPVLTTIIEHAVRSHTARIATSGSKADPVAKSKELRTREVRLLDLYESGHLEKEAYITRKSRIEAERIDLELTKRQKAAVTELDIAEIARLIVRGANAFKRLSDPVDQQTVVRQLFSEVRFQHDMIVGFKLQAQFADAGETQIAAGSAYSGMRTDKDSWLRPT